MWIFRSALTDLGVALGSSFYWCATELSATTAGFVFFSTGYSYFLSKTNTNYTSRCIREAL